MFSVHGVDETRKLSYLLDLKGDDIPSELEGKSQMAKYFRLAHLFAGATTANSDSIFKEHIIPYLVDVWLSDYERVAKATEVVETTANSFSYLFDIAAERLIAAWGISSGRYTGPRDKSRMAGHPLSAGTHYHRGHAIPHTLGGPTDINLVPQLASVNVGPFRILERRAVATQGSLYFTYWMYTPKSGQKPVAVDQGLLVPGQPPEIMSHRN